MRKSVSLYTRIKVNYFKLILKGVKIIEENENFTKYSKGREEISQNYNNYKLALIVIFGVYAFAYIRHNYLQSEFEVRNKPNVLIPKSVYDVRRQHYIYWEISRIARGLKKTFSYYNYDKESKLLYFIDRKGNNFIEKIIFNEERSDLLENPFLEFLIKKKPWTEAQLEKANKISAYYLSLNNRYDLDNYLHYKPLNPMDIFRWIYYHFMLKTGLADTYRYEQYMKKNDNLYNFDFLIFSSNLNSLDKEKVLDNLIILELLLIAKLHGFLTSIKIKK